MTQEETAAHAAQQPPVVEMPLDTPLPPPPLPPPPAPRRYTIEQARALLGMVHQPYYLIHSYQGWWNAPNQRTTTNRDQAHRYSLQEAIDAASRTSHDCHIDELYPDPPHEPRISEVAPGIVLLTHRQVSENLDQLDRKMTYVVRAGGGYLDEQGNITDDIAKAFRSTVSRLIDYGTGYRFQLVDQEAARAIASKRCSIVALLGASLVEMLKVAPQNPTALARILAITGKMPKPDEAKTYEDLKNWVETNCGTQRVDKQPSTEALSFRVRFWNSLMIEGSTVT